METVQDRLTYIKERTIHYSKSSSPEVVQQCQTLLESFPSMVDSGDTEGIERMYQGIQCSLVDVILASCN